MNSKKQYLEEAERLYVVDQLAIDEVAARLKLNRKTIMKWKEEGDWGCKRKSFLKSKQCFHEEMYEFARKLMKDISADIDAGEKVDQGRMYTFCKLIPMFTKVKDYEDIVAKKEEKAAPRGLTPELIAQIEEEVLGITHNDNNNEEFEEN